MDPSVENSVEVPLACQVCGRQDETIRFVAYPYVFSLVVVTFQRAFVGCWCRVHRVQRWLAASLITLILGWFGFPFGLLFTPFRLLQLGKGGVQDPKLNSLILGKLGMGKQERGDIAGAIKCYEASMMFADMPEISEKLRRLYQVRQLPGSSMLKSGFLGFAGSVIFPIFLALSGIAVGFVDSLVKVMVLRGLEVSIILFVLLQVPLLASIFFLGVISKYFVRFLISKGDVISRPLLYIVAVLSALMFVNGLVSGETFGIYAYYYANGYRESIVDLTDTLVAILIRGCLYIFSPLSMATDFMFNLILGLTLALSITFFLIVQFRQIHVFTSYRSRMQNVIQESEGFERSSGVGGWVGVAGILALIMILSAVNTQQSSVDALEAFDHIGSAIGHVNSGDYEGAIKEYETSINMRPNFPLSYVGLGYAYYFTGDLNNARENFERALSLQPDIVDAHTGLGWVNLYQEEYVLAEKEFTSALELYPQSLDGRLGLGWLYLNLFNLDKSREQFEYVISAAPDNAEAYYGLGAMEMAGHDYDRALELFNKALRLNPDITLAYVYKGFIFYREDKYSDAENAFLAAIKLDPKSYPALTGLGDIQVANYDFDEGINYYDQAIAVDSERADAYLDKAYVLMQMGDFEKALSVLEPRSENEGTIKPVIAYIYYLQGDEKNGERLIQESITFAEGLDDFQQAQVYYSIAVVQISLSDFPEAKRMGELASISNSIYLEANQHFIMTRIYSALGDYDTARTSLEHGSNIGHSELALHVTKATLLIDQEKLGDAEAELQAAIAIDQTRSNTLSLLSFVHYQQGDFSRAIADAERAIEQNPYNAYAHSQLAFAYQAEGRTEEALKEAQEAVRLNTLDGASHYILGVCYMETGKNEEAINEFEAFLARYWDRAYIRDYKIKAEEYLGQLRQSP